MSELWTELIDPATLTGYTRAALQAIDSKNTLASYLPNKTTANILVGFDQTENGLVEAAEYRAYDAEIEIGEGRGKSRKQIELPTLGQRIPVSEYDQLRLRNAGSDQYLQQIKGTAKQVAKAVAHRMEYQRGVLLHTGKATIDQARYSLDEDFGRKAELDVTATKFWNDPTADIIEEAREWCAVYREENDEDPGSWLMSTKAYGMLRRMDIFQNTVTGRPVTSRDIESILLDHDIPPIKLYDAKVKLRKQGVQRIIPEGITLMLPAPTGTNNPDGTDLGASFWGQTLTSSELDWGIAAGDRPGIVTGVFRNKRPPVIAEVVADAIGMPVLANANLSMSAKVLA